ncbi:hypothetical protein C8F04DRAFT_927379, partial [Mycena alexandri]
AFSGIHITMDQFGCLHCPYAASEKVVQKHMREKHEDRKGKPSSRLCTQVLNSGAPGANTRIRGGASTPNPSPPPSTQRPTPAKSLRDLVSNFDPKDYRAEELPNARMISPWLMRNGWHKHLEPYREHDDELIRLASVPSDDEIPGLRKAVASYFTEATNLIVHTNEVVLQRLNSADPNKDGINNTPLHNHHQGDKTFGQYINVIVRLLASLLREPEHYRMPVTEQLKSAVQSALTSFTDSVDITEHCSELHRILLALWKTKWEATENHTIHDPTMCFLALFSLELSGEFAGPKKTTGPIAKLCWGIKLCMLTQIHRLVSSGECNDQMEAFERIAPFVPSIIWTDRENWTELLYEGERFSLPRLQEVLTNVEEQIVDLWQERILFNLNLHVAYDDLSDNLTNTKPGYSFITNPLNPFAAHRHSFIEAVLKDPQLEAFFVYRASNVGDVQLDMDASRSFLSNLAEFEGLLLLHAEVTPGATIRGTELVSMLMQNTLYRLRNVMGVAKFVALIRQYDKTTNTAQKDRLIPHAASGLVADLLIQLHTFVRPFAQFLASRVFPDDPAVVGLYADMAFMDFGKVFTSAKLSAIMAKWMAPVIDWNMTIGPYRQINTAFRRKHCRGVDEEDDESVASMVQVLQAAHSKSVDRQHCGLSHNALLGITDEVLFAFLDASVAWQNVLEVVPGGLALPYHQAT